MSTTSKIFKTSAILSTALLSLLGACAIDEPIDYTTGGGETTSGGNPSVMITCDAQRDPFQSFYYPEYLLDYDCDGNAFYVAGGGGAPSLYKLDSLAQTVWEIDFGLTGGMWRNDVDSNTNSNYRSHANNLAIDRSSNVYYLQPANLDDIALIDDEPVYMKVMKMNEDGHQWELNIDVGPQGISGGISADLSGLLYVVGTKRFMDSSNEGKNLVLYKIDNGGNTIWDREFDNSTQGDWDETDDGSGIVYTYSGIVSDETGQGVTVDGSGNIYVGGTIIERRMEDSEGQPWIYGNRRLLVMKYDSNGNVSWRDELSVMDNLSFGFGVSAMTTDSLGNVYVAGNVEYDIDSIDSNEVLVGSDSFPISDGSQNFIVKYNSQGEKQWTQLFETSTLLASGGGFETSEKITKVRTDKKGNLYVYGSGATTAPTAFMVMYSSDGIKQSNCLYDNNDFGYSIMQTGSYPTCEIVEYDL
jgi:hypothetical protein